MKLCVWIEPRTTPGTFSIRYYHPKTGLPVRVKWNDKATLKAEINRIGAWLLNYQTGKGSSMDIPLVVFEDYLKALLKAGCRLSTLSIKRQSLTKFFESIFYMEQLNTEAIEKWAEGLKANYSVDSASIKLRDLRAFLRWCVKERIIEANPFVNINIPVSTFVGRRLTLEELQGLYRVTSGWFKDFLILCLETGARHGEVLGISYPEIDMDQGGWRIPPERSKTKTARIIPLSPAALQVLQKRQGLSAHVFEALDKGDTRRAWEAALKAAGIQGRVRIHDLRHTAASTFRGRRASLKAIFGWKSEVMADRYSHTELEELREDLMKNKTETFGALFGATTPKNAKLRKLPTVVNKL